MATNGPAGPADESEGTLAERLPSWALGIAFVLVVAMLPAIVLIALVTDLSEAQMDVFNIAMGIFAVMLGAGFGVTIQAGNVRAARRERDREHARRIAEIEEERSKRDEAVRVAEEAGQAAVREAQEAGDAAVRAAEEAAQAAVAEAEEAERARSDARLEAARTQVLDAVSGTRGPRIRTVSAAKLKPSKFLKKAKKSKDAFYVKASPDDVPDGADQDSIADDVARAFDDAG